MAPIISFEGMSVEKLSTTSTTTLRTTSRATLNILPGILLGLMVAGCDAEKPKARAVIIDATPEALLEHLAKLGYNKAVITGRRTEDCNNDDALVGYAVKIRVRSSIVSGIVCQDTIKQGYWFVSSDKREELSWTAIDEKLMGN